MRLDDLPESGHRGSPRRRRRRFRRRRKCRSAAAASASAPSWFWASSAGRSASTEGVDRRRRNPAPADRSSSSRCRASRRGAPARRATTPGALSHACSAAPRCSGRTFSARKARPIGRRAACYSRHDRARPAAPRRAPWDRSIARTIAKVYLDTAFFREIAKRFRGCARQGLRFRAGLCDRPRGRPSRAEPARHPAEGAARAAQARAAPKPTACRCGSSCRPTASPASGPIIAGRSMASSSRATSKRRCRTAAAIGDDTLQRRSQGTWCRTASPTAAPAAQALVLTGFQEGTVKACNTFAAARL